MDSLTRTIATDLELGKTLEYAPGVVIKIIDTLEEAKSALKFFACISVKDNPFIRQMQISADTFYQESLSCIAQAISDDRISCIAYHKGTGAILAVTIAIDAVSAKTLPRAEINHPMLKARGNLFTTIESEFISAQGITQRGQCVSWLSTAVLPSLQQQNFFTGLISIMLYYFKHRGYSLGYAFGVNPITMIIMTKRLELITTRLVPFDTFEFEGATPFKGFKFHTHPGYQPGVLAMLFYLKIKEQDQRELAKH